jgi:hypothetical protein
MCAEYGDIVYRNVGSKLFYLQKFGVGNRSWALEHDFVIRAIELGWLELKDVEEC